MAQPEHDRQANGLTNGFSPDSESNGLVHTSQQFLRSEKETFFSSSEQHHTVFHESVTVTRRKFIADIDDVSETDIENASVENFLDFIENQRLTHMPHRGSHWDKVLKWAEFFAVQVSGYAAALESFVPESKTAAQLIWTASMSLVRLGPENAQALATTFGEFYRLGLSVSMLLRNDVLLSANSRVRNQVGQAFNALLTLVRDVSLYYVVRLQGSAEEVSFDLNSMFGGQIMGFTKRKLHIVDEVWGHVLGNEAAMATKTLRKWLSPDPGPQNMKKMTDMAPAQREEFTCEWFQSHLLAFTRSDNDVLAMYGAAGCGKTFLSSWIVERLQRPIGRKSYVTLSFSLDADLLREATTLAVLRSLLRQLLEIDLGHKKLHQDLAEAYRASVDNGSCDLEQALWNCLEVGLRHVQDSNPTMIVFDGLEDMVGGDKATRDVISRVASIASKYPSLQVITTTQSKLETASKAKSQPFEVTPGLAHEDLRIVIDSRLQNYKHFRGRTEHAQEHLVEGLVRKAKGNFLWAVLTTVILQWEETEDGFNKLLKVVQDSPSTDLTDLVTKFTGRIDLSKPDLHQIISLLLVAERPLSVLELKCLLQIDLGKRTPVERKTDVARDIKLSLDPLIIVRDGLVRFQHPYIRSYLLKLQDEGKRLAKRPVAQSDMTKRLLVYCSYNLPKKSDPAFESLPKTEVSRTVSTLVLTKYAVRNWIIHFQSSTLYNSRESLQLDDDFKDMFPTTTQLPLLEWAHSGFETSPFGAIKKMELSVQVRKTVFSERHPSVLQNIIVCGQMWRDSNRMTEAANCFYDASMVGQHVLRKHHTITTTCTTAFLALTETFTATSRTAFVTRKENMLMYVIEMYKQQHGKTHDLVIRHYKLLAQLYVDIHEEHKAESVWRELRDIVVVRFGKGSEEDTKISENLTTVLKKGDKKTDVVEYETGIFDIITELEVWNIKRIKMTIELALSYEARGEILMAEELFVYLWRRLTQECNHGHHHHGVDIHIHLLEVVIEYTRFLRRCKRHEEASNVLICIWTEYEEYHFESEEIFLKLKIIGEIMREVSLLSVAVNVFRRCLSWFKSKSFHEHASSCEVMISETVDQLTVTTTKTSTSTSTSVVEETIVKETFESVISRKTATTETITVSQSLIAHYMRLEQWFMAIEVTKRALTMIWRSIVSGTGTIALPKDHSSGALEIAINLAICHHRMGHFYEAEAIYVRIYRACRNSCRIDDDQMSDAYGALIGFYSEHLHWHKMIEIYKEMLLEYRLHLGPTHQVTIQTLYVLGSLCNDHGYDDAHEYYLDIVDVLNHGSHVCHHDALDAMFFVCRHHFEAGNWHELRTVCKVLWETWKGQHPGHEKFTEDVVATLFFRYRYVLEHHMHCELSVLRELAIEYRTLCSERFGVDSAITIKAMVEVAQICMRSEKYLHEAISIFEEVLKVTSRSKTTTISTTTITATKKRLTEAYLTVCNHDSTSVTTIERAIHVVTERYEHVRQLYGWTSSETLTALREVIRLHLKVKKEQSTTVVMRLLQEVTVHILIKEKHSQTLYESGKTVGQLYATCGMTRFASDLIQELRLQIITGKPSGNNKHGVKVGKSNTSCFVFLVALEQAVSGSSFVGYSQVMADYLTESVLYESYHRSLNSPSISTIGYAARLRAFLVRHERHGQRQNLDQESYDAFTKKWAIQARSRDIGMLFYISLLEQLGESIRYVQLGNVACHAVVKRVQSLLAEGQVQKGFEVADCAFEFINRQGAYHHLHNISTGFKLSALMAERAGNDQKLQEQMSELSRKIIRGVLQACKDSKIDFVRLQLEDLNELVALLGLQQNYTDLEWILELLWKSREVQKKWDAHTIIAIGRRLVCARYLNKDRRNAAISLAEDICYNMRRTWGSLDPETLKMENLLDEMYTSMGHHREAMDLHESVLRLVTEGDDGDDRTLDTAASEDVLEQVERLRQCALRLRGFNKNRDVYVGLVKELKEMQEYREEKRWKNLVTPDQWNLKDPASETVGRFEAPREWGLVDGKADGMRSKKGMRKSGVGAGTMRSFSGWGAGSVEARAYGNGYVNGNGNGYANGMSNGNGRKTVKMDEEEGYKSARE